MRAPTLVIIVSIGLLFSGDAQAMLIRAFDKMADRDQADYIGDLIVGAEKALADTGKPALAAQVKSLFTTKLGTDKDTLGMVEFERSLAIIRLHDAQHPEETPSEVEDVLAIMLENNHIELPDSFYTVNENFRPKLPPKR